MAAPDSLPRGIIAHLKAQLPAELRDRLFFDVVAWRGDGAKEPRDAMPAIVVRPSITIPDKYHGGAVDSSRRRAKVDIELIWSGGVKGRNYDEFEQASADLADALVGLHGTAAIGSSVLRSDIDDAATETFFEPNTQAYVAVVRVDLLYNR